MCWHASPLESEPLAILMPGPGCDAPGRAVGVPEPERIRFSHGPKGL